MAVGIPVETPISVARKIANAGGEAILLFATGDGTTDDRAALLAASDAGQDIYLPAGTYKVDSNLTIAPKCVFADGAKIKPDNGVTVTFSSGVQADAHQHIFDISLGGEIILDQDTYITWFGADPTGVAESHEEIQAAIDTREAANPGNVFFPPGTFLLGYSVYCRSGINLRGAGYAATQLFIEDVALPSVPWTQNGSSMPDNAMLLLYGVSNITIEGIKLTASLQGFTRSSTRGDADGDAGSLIRHMTGGRYYNGSSWEGTLENIKIQDCYFENTVLESIWLAHGTDYTYTRKVYCHRNIFRSCGLPAYYGGLPVYQAAGYDFRFTDNDVEDCGSAVGLGGRDCIVTGNNIRNCDSSGISTGDSQGNVNAGSWVIANNRISLDTSVPPNIATLPSSYSGHLFIGGGAADIAGQTYTVNIHGNTMLTVNEDEDISVRSVYLSNARNIHYTGNVLDIWGSALGIIIQANAGDTFDRDVSLSGNTVRLRNELASPATPTYGFVWSADQNDAKLTINSSGDSFFGFDASTGGTSYAYGITNTQGTLLVDIQDMFLDKRALTQFLGVQYELEAGSHSLDQFPILAERRAIGHWPLQENTGAEDYKSTHDGTDGGTVTPIHLVDGPTWWYQKAVRFSDGYISIADFADMDVGTGSMTICGWFRPTTVSTYLYICGKGSRASDNHFSVLMTDGAQIVLAYGDYGVGDRYTPSGYSTVVINEWHFFAVGRNVTTGKTFRYIWNNVYAPEDYIETTETCNQSFTNALAFRIGEEHDGNNPMQGDIAGLMFFNRALSESEIKILKNGPTKPFVKAGQETEDTLKAKLIVSNAFTLDDAINLPVGSTTGTKIATATTQKLGFWNATPIVQPAHADQVAVTLGNTNSEISGLTISGAYDQSEVQALRDKCEELADDVRALSTLLHAIRTALVNAGLIKGSA